MTSSQLRVFVSSKMQELAPERLAIKSALEELKVDGWIFEKDAGARPQTIQQTFLEEVGKADLYIGLFWKAYGDYTIEEYEHARRLGKDCLIYEKRADIEGTREPRLEAFLKEIGNVEEGMTPKWFNKPEELKELVKQDVARWQAEIVRRFKVTGAPLTYQSPLPSEEKLRKELSILLKKVEQFWVKGVFEHSVHYQVLIELGKKKMAEVVEHPWETVLELPRGAVSSLPGNEKIVDVFEDVDRYLLILGEPGSGKTTTMLELAKNLVAQARRDWGQPIPVVFNLSSWSGKRLTITDWMVEELKFKYQIPQKTGKLWLEQHQLLPLLDGLDEVNPEMQGICVSAINEFIQGYPTGLVVCCRLQEYTNLQVRLKLNGAICLQPLSVDQTNEYLTKVGPELASLKESLKDDRILQELIKTPLMLSIVSLAYENQPAEVLSNAGLGTIESRRNQVFQAYIERMLERKGRLNQTYPKEKVKMWLRCLAQRMQIHSQSIFLLEQLQPNWLSTRAQKVCYLFLSRLMAGLLLGISLGIPMALAFILFSNEIELKSALIALSAVFVLVGSLWGSLLGLLTALLDVVTVQLNRKYKIFSPSHVYRNYIISAGLYMIPWFLLFALVFARLSRSLLFSLNPSKPGTAEVIFTAAFTASLYGLVHWLVFGPRSMLLNFGTEIRTTEALKWSWQSAFRGATWGTFITFMIFMPFSLFAFYKMSQESYLLSLPPPDIAENAYLLALLILFNLLYSLVGGAIGVIIGGFKRGLIERRTLPNQGIKLSARNAMLMGGAFGILTGLVTGIFVAIVARLDQDVSIGTSLTSGVKASLILGMTAGLVVGFCYGGYDVIKHYVLRIILYFMGAIPSNYTRFLNYAAALILLQRVGGGYIFIHRLLLEHFAVMNKDGTTAGLSEKLLR